jgi:mannan endo-1,4-beta-mannosidase
MFFCCLPSAQDGQGPIKTPLNDSSSKWIRRVGSTLYEGSRIFKFASFNVPNLLLIEDRPCMRGTWVVPDLYEIQDAIQTLKVLGCKVARSYTFGIGPKLHITGLREYNEDCFVALDHVLNEARRASIRLIIPLINNHFGGDGNKDFGFGDYGLLARFRGLPPSAFFTNSDLKEDFLHLIQFLLLRKNTVNGIL